MELEVKSGKTTTSEVDYKYECVLLIDDNEIDNYINKRIIEYNKFARRVVVKNSCRDAIDFLKNDAPKHMVIPDIIFLDYFMPIANGEQFLDEFSQLPGNIREHSKVILLTVLFDSNPINRKYAEFLSQRITKPLTEENLVTI